MLRRATPLLLFAACALLGACKQELPADPDRPETSREFPRAFRPVSELGANSVSSEQARDDRNEANTVMDLAQIRPGMTVADIGRPISTASRPICCSASFRRWGSGWWNLFASRNSPGIMRSL